MKPGRAKSAAAAVAAAAAGAAATAIAGAAGARGLGINGCIQTGRKSGEPAPPELSHPGLSQANFLERTRTS